MTDKPSVISLQAAEWNALIASKTVQLTQFFQQNPTPTPELQTDVQKHIERIWAMLPAWLASAPPAAPTLEQPKPVVNGTPAKAGYTGKKRGPKPKHAQQ